MTVATGVVTVAVLLVGVVTVTTVTGVLTVTFAATVTGDVVVGSRGRETVGSRSFWGEGDETTLVVDKRTDARVAAPAEPCLDAGTVLALESPVVLKRRRVKSGMGRPPRVRSDSSAGRPERVADAAVTSVPIGATIRAVTTPVVARPAATTTAAVLFATATCGIPARRSQRHSPMPPTVTPSA